MSPKTAMLNQTWYAFTFHHSWFFENQSHASSLHVLFVFKHPHMVFVKAVPLGPNINSSISSSQHFLLIQAAQCLYILISSICCWRYCQHLCTYCKTLRVVYNIWSMTEWYFDIEVKCNHSGISVIMLSCSLSFHWWLYIQSVKTMVQRFLYNFTLCHVRYMIHDNLGTVINQRTDNTIQHIWLFREKFGNLKFTN